MYALPEGVDLTLLYMDAQYGWVGVAVHCDVCRAEVGLWIES